MTEVLVLLLLVAGAAGLGSTHLLRNHERLVVTRRGRVRGVHGPGVVVVRPLARSHRVSLLPWRLGPLVARATTVEGHEVALTATCLLRVEDPVRAARARDPHGLAADAVERALVAHAASRSLDDLVGPVSVDVDASTWGVVVEAVELERADVRLTAHVLAR